jgi:hypothetical protein
MHPQRLGRTLTATCIALAASGAFGHVSAQSAASAGPVIEQVEPTSGPAGTVVNIIGRRFGADSKVSLGAQALPIVQSLPNRISVRVPEGVQSGNMAVTSAGVTVRGPEFRLTPPLPAPVIDSIDPPKGPPGTHVAIKGKHFSPLLTGNVVTLAGQPVVVRLASPEELQVIVPQADTAGPFVVRVGLAGEVASKQVFQIAAATAVLSVEPMRGGPGSQVTIRGRGFSKVLKNDRVYLNNAALSVKSATDTELVVTLPPKVASGKLLVDVVDAGRAYSSEPFVVQRPPSIVDFNPKRGAPGTLIAVRGMNFGDNVQAIDAKLGEVKLLVRDARDTSLSLELPPGAADGKLSIRVHDVGPVWSAQPFAVLPVLKLTNFSPQSGPAGSEVAIEGQGFADTVARVRVTIGGQPAHVLEATPKRLRLRVPKTKSGPIAITIAGSGEVRTTDPFVVTVPPVIASVAPRQGVVGTELTIHGSGFGANPAVPAVTLGGEVLPVVKVRPDELVVRVPAGAKTGHVKVAIPLQGEAETDWDFEVLAAPAPAAPPAAPH